MGDGIQIGRMQMPACECGSESWEASRLDKSISVCAECGVQYIVVDRVSRCLIDGLYHSVHEMTRVRMDGEGESVVLMRIGMGKDDQKPEHDGVDFFAPTCVAHLMRGGSLYTYVKYCGACLRKIGSLGEVKEFCPRCGKGVAHYTFRDGVFGFTPDGYGGMPDVLPEGLPLWDSGSA